MKTVLKFIIFFLAAILCEILLYKAVSAEVIYMKKGTIAIEDGYFYTVSDQILLKVKLDTLEQKYQIQLDYELKKQAIEMQNRLDKLQISYDTLKINFDFMLKTKNDQIKNYEDALGKALPKWYDSKGMWYTFGVVSGIIITATGYYIFRKTN